MRRWQEACAAGGEMHIKVYKISSSCSRAAKNSSASPAVLLIAVSLMEIGFEMS